MRSVLIGKDVAIGDGTSAANVSDINSLTDGALSIYDVNGKKLNTAALLGASSESVTLHIGGDIIPKSSAIDRDNVTYEFQPYVAPAKKEIFFGDYDDSATYDLKLPSAIEGGMEVGIHIVKGEKIKSRHIYKEYHSIVAEDSDTFTTALTKLVNKINRDSKVVQASSVLHGSDVVGIKIISIDTGVPYEATVAGFIRDADKIEYQLVNDVYTSGNTDAAALSIGHGTYVQVLDLEARGNAEDGKLTTESSAQSTWSEHSKVISGGTYDYHVIRWMDARRGTTSMKTNYENELILAIPAGDNSNDIKTVLEAL